MSDEGKLFIGGLSFDTTEESLAAAFGKYGTIEKVDVIRDRETGKSRGFGFVKYDNPDDARDALDGMNGKTLDGRPIRVDEAGKGGRPRGGGYGGGPRGGRFGSSRGRGSRGSYRGGGYSSDRAYGDRSSYSDNRSYGERSFSSGDRGFERQFRSGGYPSGGGCRDRNQYERMSYRDGYDGYGATHE